tara:strand:+ start:515 stop:733 length:219 start_codon:yes stop_codon:yes gene_type:complete
MTHTAKRIGSGEYEYRGFAISHVYSESWGDWTWYIAATTSKQGSDCFDPTNTLRDAKAAIDYAIAHGHAVPA